MNDPILFDLPVWEGKIEPIRLNKNPMVRKNGLTPGKKCKSCIFLCYHQTAKRYYKCKKRGCTFGAGTDHRVNYEACKLYEPILKP